MSYLRAHIIAPWLCDGEEFGEEGCDLELDRYLVKTVALRHRILKVSEGISGLRYAQSNWQWTELQNIARECIELEQLLRLWPLTLPAEYRYSIVDVDTTSITEGSPFYSDTAHWYNGIRYSTAWNRYRVTRLVCNGMASHAIRALQRYSFPLEDDMSAAMEESIFRVRSLVDEICASVPSFYGVISPKAYAAAPNEVSSSASSTVVYQLVWPLAVCAACTWISDHQRRWVQGQLYLASQATGSGVVEVLSQIDLQESHKRLAYLSLGSMEGQEAGEAGHVPSAISTASVTNRG